MKIALPFFVKLLLPVMLIPLVGCGDEATDVSPQLENFSGVELLYKVEIDENVEGNRDLVFFSALTRTSSRLKTMALDHKMKIEEGDEFRITIHGKFEGGAAIGRVITAVEEAVKPARISFRILVPPISNSKQFRVFLDDSNDPSSSNAQHSQKARPFPVLNPEIVIGTDRLSELLKSPIENENAIHELIRSCGMIGGVINDQVHILLSNELDRVMISGQGWEMQSCGMSQDDKLIPGVSMTLDASGAKLIGEMSKKHHGKLVAILVNGQVVYVGKLERPVSGRLFLPSRSREDFRKVFSEVMRHAPNPGYEILSPPISVTPLPLVIDQSSANEN